jgi:ubiquinol-cytochrome c reductase cytochrome b subunit
VRSGRFRPLFKVFFWLLLADCVLLGYLGGKPAEGIYVTLSRLATAYYFIHFLVILPLLSVVEKTRPLPQSISMPISGGGMGAVAAKRGKADA